MRKVLVVLGHSNYDNSLSNKTIIDAVTGTPGVSVRKLHEVSDNFSFNIEAEQKALTEADVIVFQFPFHWYALPAIFKKWVDDVLTFGFAYGPGGDKLAGKKVVLSITTGAPEDAYKTNGDKGYTVDQFIAPLKETIAFTSMELAGTVVSNGMLFIPGVMGDKDAVTAKAEKHAQKLKTLVESL
jgi:putative NADPH-quinone reductase